MKKCVLFFGIAIMPCALYSVQPAISLRQAVIIALKQMAVDCAVSLANVKFIRLMREMVRHIATRPVLFQYPMHVPRELKFVAPETVPTCIQEMANVINSGQAPAQPVLLLYGPAGTGKTASVKWLAQQTGCKLLFENGGNINGNRNAENEFDSIGWLLERAAPSWFQVIKQHASRITRLWRSNGEPRKPIIILIDEGDSFFTDPAKSGVLYNLKKHILASQYRNSEIIWCITTNLRQEDIHRCLSRTVVGSYCSTSVRTECVALPTGEQQAAICRFYASDYPEHSFAGDVNFNQMPLEGLSGADIKYAIQHAWARAFTVAHNNQSRPIITNEFMRAAFQERQVNIRLIAHQQPLV